MNFSKHLHLIFISLFLISTACEKRSEVVVKYIASESISDFEISWRNASGNLVTEIVAAQSLQDRWEYDFVADQGQIVYISGKYSDLNSSLRLMILIDGKIYKQGFSNGDTLKYLTVSGVVPY